MFAREKKTSDISVSVPPYNYICGQQETVVCLCHLLATVMDMQLTNPFSFLFESTDHVTNMEGKWKLLSILQSDWYHKHSGDINKNLAIVIRHSFPSQTLSP